VSVIITLILLGMLAVRELATAYRGPYPPPQPWLRWLNYAILFVVLLFVMVIAFQIISVLLPL
jgi:hypothetical protein